MAQPIPLDLSIHDPRVERQSRLRDTPAEHAEALLAAYEVTRLAAAQSTFRSMIFGGPRNQCAPRPSISGVQR